MFSWMHTTCRPQVQYLVLLGSSKASEHPNWLVSMVQNEDLASVLDPWVSAVEVLHREGRRV